MLNKTFFIGSLVKLDCRKTKTDLMVAEATLKVISRKNRNELETNEFSITFFGRTAEDLEQVKIGSQLYVDCKARLDSFNKDGSKGPPSIKFVGNSFEVLVVSEGQENVKESIESKPQDDEIPF